jgi:DNA polymerase/3'-5' exonuclease PolX
MEERLTYFYSIGKVQAKRLLAELISLELIRADQEYSIDQLREILKKPEIYEQLSLATRIDLVYKPLREIPRRLISLIEREFRRLASGFRFQIAGSYFRGSSSSGDVDLVLEKKNSSTWDEFFRAVSKSTRLRVLLPFQKGSEKLSTLIELEGSSVKLDCFLAPPNEYLFTLLFAIGSGLFNIRMRAVAKRRGFLLNNRGLFKRLGSGKLKKIPVRTEREIFRILKMHWKSPRERI